MSSPSEIPLPKIRMFDFSRLTPHPSGKKGICFVKNIYGNYVNLPSNLIIDIHTKKIIGIQNKNGSVEDVSEEKINMIMKNLFQ